MCIEDAAKAVEFYKTAFRAEEVSRSEESDGRIGHAEIRIALRSLTLIRASVEAGAKPLMAIKGRAHGGRRARLTDPFGHVSTLSTPVDK